MQPGSRGDEKMHFRASVEGTLGRRKNTSYTGKQEIRMYAEAEIPRNSHLLSTSSRYFVVDVATEVNAT